MANPLRVTMITGSRNGVHSMEQSQKQIALFSLMFNVIVVEIAIDINVLSNRTLLIVVIREDELKLKTKMKENTKRDLGFKIKFRFYDKKQSRDVRRDFR